ncbi:MAG: C-GCAxxG-C-C family protein [Oscillospiraceae bacterium]|nr:C-GCAxxG-C-C family protein [Oscillospiraceae bacterium]
MKRSEKAVENHRSFYPCSSAVMCAFADAAGMTEQEASAAARPMAGGRMGKCGAVLAAETVLSRKYGADDARIGELNRRFIDKHSSVMCSELKSGAVKSPCRSCVTDAAEILESLLEGADI